MFCLNALSSLLIGREYELKLLALLSRVRRITRAFGLRLLQIEIPLWLRHLNLHLGVSRELLGLSAVTKDQQTSLFEDEALKLTDGLTLSSEGALDFQFSLLGVHYGGLDRSNGPCLLLLDCFDLDGVQHEALGEGFGGVLLVWFHHVVFKTFLEIGDHVVIVVKDLESCLIRGLVLGGGADV